MFPKFQPGFNAATAAEAVAGLNDGHAPETVEEEETTAELVVELRVVAERVVVRDEVVVARLVRRVVVQNFATLTCADPAGCCACSNGGRESSGRAWPHTRCSSSSWRASREALRVP